MLFELAREVAREAVFRSEREATRADAGVPAVANEERDWDRATGDGIA